MNVSGQRLKEAAGGLLKSNFNSRIIADTIAAKYIKPDDGSPSKKYAKFVPIAWRLSSDIKRWIAPQIARQIGISIRSVRIDLKALRDGGFITKETESTRSPWVVLKKE